MQTTKPKYIDKLDLESDVKIRLNPDFKPMKGFATSGTGMGTSSEKEKAMKYA